MDSKEDRLIKMAKDILEYMELLAKEQPSYSTRIIATHVVDNYRKELKEIDQGE